MRHRPGTAAVPARPRLPPSGWQETLGQGACCPPGDLVLRVPKPSGFRIPASLASFRALAELAQDVLGVLAEPRRWPLGCGRLAVEQDRSPQARDAAGRGRRA